MYMYVFLKDIFLDTCTCIYIHILTYIQDSTLYKCTYMYAFLTNYMKINYSLLNKYELQGSLMQLFKSDTNYKVH